VFGTEETGVAELFGDRADFAIEVGVEPDLKRPNPVFGHMCVWCGGAALGNIDDHYCALYPAYCAFGSLASRIDRLWADEFEGLDDAAIYDLLDGLLYGGRFDSPVQPPSSLFDEAGRRSWAVWGCFNFLTNWGEQFDGYKSFLACPPGGPARVLSKAFIGHTGISVQVSPAGVVAATESFCRWFDEQAMRLRT
jgi:hypothetical protein